MWCVNAQDNLTDVSQQYALEVHLIYVVDKMSSLGAL